MTPTWRYPFFKGLAKKGELSLLCCYWHGSAQEVVPNADDKLMKHKWCDSMCHSQKLPTGCQYVSNSLVELCTVAFTGC